MGHRPSNDDGLDRLFAAARAGPPPAPPPWLTDRVLADAARVSAARASAAAARPPRRPWPSALAERLGGGRVATALAGAAAVGFCIGLASADAVLGGAGVAGDAAAEMESLDAPVVEFFELARVEP